MLERTSGGWRAEDITFRILKSLFYLNIFYWSGSHGVVDEVLFSDNGRPVPAVRKE